MSLTSRTNMRKLIAPLLVCALTGFIFFSAGSAYQTFGLAALDKSRQVISHFLGITLFMSFGVLLDRMVRHVILDGFIAKTLGTPVPGLLKQFSTIIIYLFIIATILSVVFKKDLTVLWAASGVAGIVLGLALQTLLQDIYSGLALNIDRPLKIGDSIQIDVGSIVKGEVKEISWRTTHILDKANNTIVLPNNKVAAATITNFSDSKRSSVEFRDITIDTMIPHERVMRILTAAAIEACAKFPSTDALPPYVLVWDISHHGTVYRVHYYCDLWHKDQAQSLILQCLLSHLRQAGLRPAMPKIEHLALENSGWRDTFPSNVEAAFVLSVCPLLHGLTPENFTLLADKAKIETIPADQAIIHAGETGSSAFVLIEGLVTAIRKRGKTPDMPEMLRPGDCFGFEAALLGDAYPVTIRTRTMTIVCEMDAVVFGELFSTCTKSVQALSQNLAKATVTTGETSRLASDSDVEIITSDIERSIKRNFASAIRKRGQLLRT